MNALEILKFIAKQQEVCKANYLSMERIALPLGL
jgi:hypothetical protein